MDSRISGFYSLSIHERRAAIANAMSMELPTFRSWGDPESLDESTANRMIENVVGRLSLPVGIAMNFLIDGKSTFIPFCVEESSIVAAASNIAKRARNSGGFTTDVDPPRMIGQLQILDVPDMNAAIQNINQNKDCLLYTSDAADE